jgi:hypothetical protein
VAAPNDQQIPATFENRGDFANVSGVRTLCPPLPVARNRLPSNIRDSARLCGARWSLLVPGLQARLMVLSATQKANLDIREDIPSGEKCLKISKIGMNDISSPLLPT